MAETNAMRERRAETFELFFDLMFVFAITQITHLIETAQNVADWIAALSVFSFLWWMYAGFIWLASNSTRTLPLAWTLLIAMLGFFMLAVGIPGIHSGETVLAGGAALFIVATHIAGFALIADAVTGRAIFSFGWLNVLVALLLLLSGWLPHGKEWFFQLAVVVLLTGMAVLYRARTFQIVPSHFVERHGLLLIIVFGESIIALGTALGEHQDPVDLLEACLVIALVIALWLSWFSYDDRRSERALSAAPNETRGQLALVAYWFAFAIMIVGILLLAAGTKLQFEGHGRPGPWIAAALAFYFAGMALFRWELGLAGSASRAVGAFLALLIWPAAAFIGNSESIASPAHGFAENIGAILPLMCALTLASLMLIVDRMQLGQGQKTQP